MNKNQHNKNHQYLLDKLSSLAEEKPFKPKLSLSYSGSKQKSFPLRTAQIRSVCKLWVKNHPEIKLGELIALFTSLLKNAQTSTEKYLVGYILNYLPKQRREIKPALLDDWLNHLNGWAQIDSLCQSKFTAKDLLTNWSDWKKLLIEFNQSNNISKQRASLVLLTGPVKKDPDERLAKLALANITSLLNENDRLITKAISWLLRAMIMNHRQLVAAYLSKYRNQLPRVAVRETTNKLKTGKK